MAFLMGNVTVVHLPAARGAWPGDENGDMPTGVLVLLVAVALATGLGLWRLARDGRFRGTRRVKGAGSPAPAAELGLSEVLSGALGKTPAELLGQRATLLQFSSAFCAPCRATRRTLSEVADVVPGVRHLEVDAEGHLELVRQLGVLRTPTTLVLDAAGREVVRASGAPQKDAVFRALASAVDHVTE